MAFTMARLARGAVLLCLGVSPTLASAQAIDLPGILSLVEKHNPELAVAREQRAIADGEVRIAGAYPNPEIEIGAGPWRSRVGGTSGNARQFGITQPIDLPSVRAPRIAGAQAGIAAADAGVQLARLAIGYQTKLAAADLLRRQEDQRIAQENVGLLGQIRDRVLARVAVGEAPRFELVRADAEALAAQNTLASARLRVEESRATLRRLAGNALPPAFELRGDLAPVLDGVPDLARLQAEVVSAHPALRGLAAERDQALSRVEQERALRAPQPALRFSESRDPETRAATVGVTLSVPLWNRREGQIARALAGVNLADAQLEREKLQLLRELDSASSRLLIAQRQIQTFEAGLLKSAENALQVAEAAYRFGERSFLEVLDAQRTLRIVRGDYNLTRYERLAAWLDIERLRARNPFEGATK